MPSRSSKPRKEKRDFAQVAFDIVQQLTREKPPEAITLVGDALDNKEMRKALMQEMGRRGGKKGGKARAAKLTSEKRSEIAKRAAQSRWAK